MSSPPSLLRIVALALAALVALPRSVAAQGPRDEVARRHYHNGVSAFKAGDYPRARREFEAGYKLSRRSRFLLNMAHAERRIGDLEKASALYRRYLLADPATPLRRSVESLIEELELASADLAEADAKASQRAATPRPPAAAPAGPRPPRPPPAAPSPADVVPPRDSLPDWRLVPPSTPVPIDDRPSVVEAIDPLAGTASDAAGDGGGQVNLDPPVDTWDDEMPPGLAPGYLRDRRGEPPPRPLLRRPWFWVGTGLALAAGAASIWVLQYRR